MDGYWSKSLCSKISGGMKRDRPPTTVGIIKLEYWAIMWRCLRHPMFSGFGTVPSCDRQTDKKTDGRRTHDDV